MKYDSLIFDLDGTLWDSTQLCAEAWNESMEALKLKSKKFQAKDVEQIMGLPHDEVFKKLFPEYNKEIREKIATEFYEREINRVKRNEAAIYPGVLDGLKLLSQKYPLYIVSNCMTEYLEAFYFVTGMRHHFKDAECYGHQGKLKAHNLSLIRERNQLKNPVYIGDTAGDEKASREAKIDFMFVSYGFGTVVKPLETFHSFYELSDYFLR